MDDGTPDPDRTPDAVPSLRASDAERDETARRLQDAFSEGRLTLAEFDERTTRAYAARFRDELGELTRDLSPARRDAGPGTGPSTSLAIMGGCERAGAWTLPADHTAVALMGGIEIDLREATLQSNQTTIRAFAVMGGIDILVPDDIHLEVEGLGIMGGFAEESGEWAPDPRPVRQAPPGAPRVRVTGLALMGGVGVRRVPAPAPRA